MPSAQSFAISNCSRNVSERLFAIRFGQREFVGQLSLLLAGGHEVECLLARFLAAAECRCHRSLIENDEPVTDQHGMPRIMGYEHNAYAALLGGADDCQYLRRLFDAKR